MPKILISEKVADETITFLENHNIEIKKGRGLDSKTICEDIVDCDAVMVRVMRIDREILNHAPKLKVIAKHGVGCDSIDYDAAKEYGIPIVYSPGSNSISVAEHTIALMLLCSHQIKHASIEYSKGNYAVKDSLAITEITGKTLGLIGCGNVALHVARMAYQGFDMKIIGFDPYLNKEVPKYISFVDSVESLIAESDFISIHIPGNKENENFFDKKKLMLMKNNAFLINTARGDVVNTTDLLNSLQEKSISGAGLDVCNPEPVPSECELFSRDDVLLTPHIGAASKESMVRMGLMAAEGVVAVLNGRTPKWIYKR